MKIKYPIDSSLFSKIDEEWKAYFLGFMYADGYVSKLNHASLSLIESDREILDKLNILIYGTPRPLYYVIPNSIKVKKRRVNARPYYILPITSKLVTQNLINHGCVNRKSLTLEFPHKTLSADLIPHFIRGYFDGDGCVTQIKKSKYFTLAGTISFLSSIKNIFSKIGIKSKISKNTCHKIYYLKIFDVRTLRDVYEYLYSHSSISLERKYRKFSEILNDSHLLRLTSKHRNVSFEKFTGKWKVCFRIKGKTIRLGRFINERDAVIARDAYIERLGA